MDKITGFFKKHPVIFMGMYLIVYFSIFILLEETVTPKYIIHSPIDDIIPFCEYFIVPYLLWFLYVPGILFYLVSADRDTFWKMVKMMFVGNMLCLLIYALFPNGVHTKHYIPSDNIFSHIVNIVYYTDTPTNVCPSIHVFDALSAHIALSRSRNVKNKPLIKNASCIFLILVCISTVTLKQHSIIDVLAAFILMFIMEKYAYKKDAQTHSVAIV